MKPEIQFESDDVRVYKTRLLPNEPINQSDDQCLVFCINENELSLLEKAHCAFEPKNAVIIELKNSQNKTWPSIPLD